MKSLRILHLPKRTGMPVPSGPAGAFFLDTCQRALWLFMAGAWDGQRPEGTELFEGVDAYRFLLRVATGLESEVQGETDIFGQLKQAWASYERSVDAASAQPGLVGWIQKAFEDTKEIRSLHLQNNGGASYGSLVRMLVRKHSTGPQESILIVGAGHIARSVAPLLTEFDLLIWNRSPQAAIELAQDLASRHGASARAVIGEAGEREAWKQASHAVVCIPLDPEADARRIRWWKTGLQEAGGRAVIHLGGMTHASGEWGALPNFHSLDDVFALQKSQDQCRAELFARAARACEEKALLRSLSGHAWEDLAVFA